MEQQTSSKLGKEYIKPVYCYPAYLTYMQSISCEKSGWMKHKLESRLPGEISITSDIQMAHPYGRKQSWTKESLDKSERKAFSFAWESWLKTQCSINENHGIQSYHFMSNRWGNNENSEKCYFLGLQNHCSQEIKRQLLLGRKVMTNLDSILKTESLLCQQRSS